ncbi:MAG: Bcr/CflA family multidrug efflux MFS transporter, partial [Alphaproteobacteria bacterium]|nr:Bcr/CflA family multidrug efflux MFS transporter [Alphaproteobacteria bacterium]
SLPEIARSLSATDESVQRTLFAFFSGFCLGILIYGPLSDRYGRRPIVMSGITIFIVATIACALAQDITMLTAFRFLQAFGGGAASVLARAMVRDRFGQDQAARILSIMALITSTAPLLAPSIGGQILLWFDWRAIFVFQAVFAALCITAVFFKVPESHPVEQRRVTRFSDAFLAYGRILSNRIALGYGLGAAAAFGGMFAYITGTPFVYIEYFKVPPEYFGLLFGCNILSIMAANFTNSRLVSKYGVQRMARIGVLIHASGALALLFVGLTGFGGLPAIVISLLFTVGSLGFLSANCVSRLMSLFPANAGAAASIFGALQFGCGALSSLAVSTLNDGTPWAMCIVIGVLGPFSAIALFGLARKDT